MSSPSNLVASVGLDSLHGGVDHALRQGHASGLERLPQAGLQLLLVAASLGVHHLQGRSHMYLGGLEKCGLWVCSPQPIPEALRSPVDGIQPKHKSPEHPGAPAHLAVLEHNEARGGADLEPVLEHVLGLVVGVAKQLDPGGLQAMHHRGKAGGAARECLETCGCT